MVLDFPSRFQDFGLGGVRKASAWISRFARDCRHRMVGMLAFLGQLL